MATRRQRPPVERSAASVDIRLPDGRTFSMPASTAESAGASEMCCFCGHDIEPSGPEHIHVEAEWVAGAEERWQGWSAHRACLLERLHERVGREGPFFES